MSTKAILVDAGLWENFTVEDATDYFITLGVSFNDPDYLFVAQAMITTELVDSVRLKATSDNIRLEVSNLDPRFAACTKICPQNDGQ